MVSVERCQQVITSAIEERAKVFEKRSQKLALEAYNSAKEETMSTIG